jgi:hypothetical protein
MLAACFSDSLVVEDRPSSPHKTTTHRSEERCSLSFSCKPQNPTAYDSKDVQQLCTTQFIFLYPNSQLVYIVLNLLEVLLRVL